MAITIQQYPVGGQDITMAHNPIEYVVSSNNTAQTNFRYIADVYWIGATEPIRYVQGVDPTNGRCRFDFSSVMRNIVSYDAPLYIANNFVNCTNSYQTLTVKFGEQYGASSAITSYPNLTTDSIKIWNACLPIESWWNGNIPTSDYIVGTNTQKYLTDIPTRTQTNPIKLCYNDLHYLYFLQADNLITVGYVEFKIYKGASLHATVKWDNAIPNTAAVVKLGVGAKNLQAASTLQSELNITSSIGFPFMDNQVTKYSVTLYDTDTPKPNPITETLWFSIDCECTWETPYRLCFLNKLGGYDYFNFNWNSKKTSTYQKSNYKSKSWEWSTSNLISYNSNNRGNVQYSTIASDKLQLTSGWITEEESTWLEELVSSPDVYIVDNTSGNLTAVTVTDTTYDYKTLEYDQLFNLTITLEYAHNRYRQSL